MLWQDIFKVYRITNNINGKVYIGYTKQDVKERFRQHATNYATSYIHSAIKKYGVENFDIETLYVTFTQEDAFAAERTLISEHREFTELYNLTDGGEGAPGRTQPEEERKMRSEMARKLLKEDAGILEKRRKSMLEYLKENPFPTGDSAFRSMDWKVTDPHGNEYVIKGLKQWVVDKLVEIGFDPVTAKKRYTTIYMYASGRTKKLRRDNFFHNWKFERT